MSTLHMGSIVQRIKRIQLSRTIQALESPFWIAHVGSSTCAILRCEFESIVRILRSHGLQRFGEPLWGLQGVWVSSLAKGILDHLPMPWWGLTAAFR
ncbi:hypothetical protein M378DRAFT_166550 [Amanita muscaria Koide BX008]|uniref:Uncharacterized protein n=1 Tax=Amanita muscaria (strain Koide BX008) TaxID=946122 RepID=A0A0C2WY39_AMAMK|nr:hypothetical protein M378DRAFT_166550 [Amanita muscaria Koide BX008]